MSFERFALCLVACFSLTVFAGTTEKEKSPLSPLYKVGNRDLGWDLQGATTKDDFINHIQPMFTQRCTSCHGCYEAPCNFNMQSYEGIRRGFSPTALYSGKRISEVPPIRLSDAAPPADPKLMTDEARTRAWRARHFFAAVPHPSEPDKSDHPAQFKTAVMQQLLEMSKANNEAGFSVKEIERLKDVYNEDQRSCIATAEQIATARVNGTKGKLAEVSRLDPKSNFYGMPFGFPKLKDEQYEKIEGWMKAGSPGPSAEAEKLLNTPRHAPTIERWENFFNADTINGRATRQPQLAARYIYEHVFTAILHFDESAGEYYELVRSRTRTGAINEIVTDLPYSDPGVPRVFYRLRKITRALVQKTQNVWRLNNDRLDRLVTLFHSNDWGSSEIPPLSYATNNQFIYFQRIPAEKRARFMMENSKVIVGAMVQGTVCIGSRATYAIADHFWTGFLKPERDPSVRHPALGLHSVRLLGTAPQPWQPSNRVEEAFLTIAERIDLAGKAGRERLVSRFRPLLEKSRLNIFRPKEDSAVGEIIEQMHRYGASLSEILGAVRHFMESIDANQEYQEAFERQFRIDHQGRGLSFDDLWKGDGDPKRPNNPNAALNITRHKLSATVQFGFEGGPPQSMWVLSYSNFERLYYNLVAHFKVWGNLYQKVATWRHMSYVRREGEDLAISMLPLRWRPTVREWFTHGMGGVTDHLFFPNYSAEFIYTRPPLIPNPLGKGDLRPRPTAHPELDRNTARDTVRAFVERWRSDLNEVALAGRFNDKDVNEKQAEFEKDLTKLQYRNEVKDKDRFAQFIPDITYVRVDGPNQQSWVYSLIANRGYHSHNLVFAEDLTRDETYDTLSVYRGTVGAYPHLFLHVRDDRRNRFASDLEGLTEETWPTFLRNYAVSRTSNEVWTFFDWLHDWKGSPHPGNDPVEQAVVDLSQYYYY